MDPLSNSFSERFVDRATGRTVITLRWDRGWTTVRAELPSGTLPPVTDLQLFEGAGLVVPSDIRPGGDSRDRGDIVVRIDRNGARPTFAVTLGGQPLVSLAEDSLTPHARAELAAAAQAPSGSSTRALAVGIGALVGAVLLVTFGVMVFFRSSSESNAASPGGGLFSPAPVPSQITSPFATTTMPGNPGVASIGPGSTVDIFAGDQTDRFITENVSALGVADPTATLACMTSRNTITEQDVIEFRAPYRSSLYQCAADELSKQWMVSATGLSPADQPCARKASVVGLGRLSLDELDTVGPTANSTQFPPEIQNKLVAVVRELCPQIPAEVAERVVKE
jgi:hypothetical protein